MIYSPQVSRAKNGSPTPLFSDGTAMHSAYNPEREAETFGSDIPAGTGCIVVGGIGGGFHIAALRAHFPEALIIAFEGDEQSLSFCKQIDLVSQLENSNTFYCTVGSLKATILSHYLPALHNAFAFTVQRSWADKNKDSALEGKEISDEALKAVSADYSVQSHFGRNWQRNILLNLSFLSKTCAAQEPISFDTKKTAAVIAAGPSLDKTISLLQKKRSEYVIFSTDTAYGTLLAHHVIPDAVVSIDGQLVSETHFYCCPHHDASSDSGSVSQSNIDVQTKTSFFFDLCASPTAVRLVSERGYPIHFLQSGHPLSSLACSTDSVPLVNTGSGTVTIAAADVARLLGFKKVELFGADFCYSSGKPYAKGTYLDTNFSIGSSRLSTRELSFAALQFRTPLLQQTGPALFSGKLDNAFTTDVLQSYGKTLLGWISTVNGRHDGNAITLPTALHEQKWPAKPCSFSYASFLSSWIAHLSDVHTCNQYALSVLPYISFLKSHAEPSCNLSFFELVKLAYSEAVRYTI